MLLKSKRDFSVIILSLAITLFISAIAGRFAFLDTPHWKIYDTLTKLEYRLRPLPAAKDILLVTIDNETLNKMPRPWPYPRSDFAQVIRNLEKAQVRLIGFDFVFPGQAAPEDDLLLRQALKDSAVVMASAIDEEGILNFSQLPDIDKDITAGIITKLQDNDGITRKNLTYLVSEKNPNRGFLSWEMQLLKVCKGIDLATLSSSRAIVSFGNTAGERWEVPVDPKTKSFLIPLRMHTSDFRRLSFCRAFNADFDPAIAKGKIALIGITSTILGDLHNTPLGWLPGLTLNANAFLSLCNHDFLRKLPVGVDYFVAMLAVFLAALLILRFETKKAFLFMAGEIFVFFLISFLLLMSGYVWNYALLPVSIILAPILSRKFYPPE